MSKKNCKCAYTKTWEQDFEKIEYKLVGGEKFSGNIRHDQSGLDPNNDYDGWSASASDGTVSPTGGDGGGRVSTVLQAGDWQVKEDWKKSGGPKNEKKDPPFSTCKNCVPDGNEEELEKGDEKPGDERSGEPKSVTVTFTGNNNSGGAGTSSNDTPPPNFPQPFGSTPPYQVPFEPPPSTPPASDTDNKNCKTRERKVKRTDKFKQKYTCNS